MRTLKCLYICLCVRTHGRKLKNITHPVFSGLEEGNGRIRAVLYSVMCNIVYGVALHLNRWVRLCVPVLNSFLQQTEANRTRNDDGDGVLVLSKGKNPFNVITQSFPLPFSLCLSLSFIEIQIRITTLTHWCSCVSVVYLYDYLPLR